MGWWLHVRACASVYVCLRERKSELLTSWPSFVEVSRAAARAATYKANKQRCGAGRAVRRRGGGAAVLPVTAYEVFLLLLLQRVKC